MVVALGKGYFRWDFRIWRDCGKINAGGLRRGELSAEVAGDRAGTASYIEDPGWVLDWGLEDFAKHHRLYGFMLAIESPMFAWTELGYLLREDGRLGKTIPGRYLVRIFGGFLGFHFISEFCGNISPFTFALVSDDQSRKMILNEIKMNFYVNAEVGSKRRLYAEINKSIDHVSLTTHGTPYQ